MASEGDGPPPRTGRGGGACSGGPRLVCRSDERNPTKNGPGGVPDVFRRCLCGFLRMFPLFAFSFRVFQVSGQWRVKKTGQKLQEFGLTSKDVLSTSKQAHRSLAKIKSPETDAASLFVTLVWVLFGGSGLPCGVYESTSLCSQTPPIIPEEK